MNPKRLVFSMLPCHFSIPKNLQTLTLTVEYFIEKLEFLYKKESTLDCIPLRVWAADNICACQQVPRIKVIEESHLFS